MSILHQITTWTVINNESEEKIYMNNKQREKNSYYGQLDDNVIYIFAVF